jgi:hypothetical protein
MTEATQRFEALVKPEGPAGHPIEANSCVSHNYPN